MNIYDIKICLTSESYTNISEYIKSINDAFLKVVNEERSILTLFDIIGDLRYTQKRYCPKEKFEIFKTQQINLFKGCSKGNDYREAAFLHYLDEHKEMDSKINKDIDFSFQTSKQKTRLNLSIVHCGNDVEMATMMKQKYGYHLYHIHVPENQRIQYFIDYNPGYTNEMEKEFKIPVILPLSIYDDTFSVEVAEDIHVVAYTIFIALLNKCKKQAKQLKELEQATKETNLLGI